MTVKYILYFLVGGTIVSTVTYFAGHSRGLTAAFVANLPVMTLITFLTIYFEAGDRAVMSYAKGLLIMLFPWLAYIFTLIILTPRAGVIPSLGIGFLLYLSLSLFIIMGTRP
jgi:hypothetical protein